MLPSGITQVLVRTLDRLARKRSLSSIPGHLVIGRRGEEDAYFYLRRQGYTIVARNFRTSRHRGEIDLIGWDKDVLCFIEVKSRTTREVKPAEAAVDREKRRDLRVMVRYYLRSLPKRQFPTLPQWRFDILTVYYDKDVPLPPVSGLREAPPSPKGENANPVPFDSRCTSEANASVHKGPTFELFRNASLSS